MTKYKLIKDFPRCSINVGTLVEWNDTDGEYIADVLPCNEGFSKESVEKYPEFWEEIKEPEFKILEFKHKSDGILRLDTQLKDRFCYSNGKAPFYNESELLTYKTISIHKIERLSDGEVFTVGDIISFSPNETKVIIKISLDKNPKGKLYELETPYLICDNNYGMALSIAKKALPLFTTEDGVDKYKGDSYYYIIENQEIGDALADRAYKPLVHIVDWVNPKMLPLGYVQFHDLTPALEYIDLHKPKYSKHEILSLTNVLKHKSYCYWDDIIKNTLSNLSNK